VKDCDVNRSEVVDSESNAVMSKVYLSVANDTLTIKEHFAPKLFMAQSQIGSNFAVIVHDLLYVDVVGGS